MTRAHKALAILVVSTLGLWGCAKGPTNGSPLERIKALEFKMNKLEEDLGIAEAARDQLRQKLASMEERLTQIQKQRDDLQQQLAARTVERDTVQTQYDQFRQGIRELLGQAEANAARTSKEPVTAASTGPQPGKS